MGSIRFPQSDPIKSNENHMKFHENLRKPMELNGFPMESIRFPQSNPMEISWKSNENQWNSMEFNGIPNEIQRKGLFGRHIQEIPSRVLLIFRGGGGLLIRGLHYTSAYASFLTTHACA